MKLTPALLLPLMIAACTGPVPPAEAPRVPLASATPGFVPPSTAAGETDCGTFVLQQGKGLAEEAMRCFIDAAAQGRPARLMESRLTVEGDPIISLYRVKAGGGIEVIRDTTRDRYGNHGIVTETCTGPVADRGFLMFAHCDR
ncbi:MAG TPA: hypothetical protein VFC19_46740 [Candidatus Limnocylindrales bacterium]|nr:hypothetical protein [Candidatus Limnocylindrales bacterium]